MSDSQEREPTLTRPASVRQIVWPATDPAVRQRIKEQWDEFNAAWIGRYRQSRLAHQPVSPPQPI